MKLKVLAGYNRFKSDNVFFSGVEVAETSDKYENKQFSSFQNCNSSINSMMNDIVKVLNLQFSVNNFIWKIADFFRGKTQRSPSRKQSKLSNLNLQIVAVSNRLYPFQKGWEFHKYY